MSRASRDPEWADEVIRRWNRRRFRRQQQDKAWADLKAAIAKDLAPILAMAVRLASRLGL